MLTLFTFTADDLATTTAYIGDIFTDAKLLIILAMGIPLAFYVIKKIMALLPKR